MTFVFADFPRPRRPRGAPVEVPIDEHDPLAREWALVCDSGGRAACLAAWEPPGQEGVADGDRLFETIWTVDRDTTRTAARICCELASAAAPDVAAAVSERLAPPPARTGDDGARAEALANRMIAYLSRTAER